jgi:hypothetical protein
MGFITYKDPGRSLGQLEEVLPWAILAIFDKARLSYPQVSDGTTNQAKLSCANFPQPVRLNPMALVALHHFRALPQE